jgi:hypothetical protein
LIQRISFIVVDGERRVAGGTGMGVGELTGAPARIGEVRGYVVVDDESSGTGGVSGDGSN